MHFNVFTEISIVISLGAVIALIMRMLRQPLIIGHIITGVIAGPAFLNIIHAESSFAGLSSMGVALLLFIIGLDLSTRIFSRLGKAVLVTSSVQILAVTAVGYLVSQSLGFSKLESAIIGLALSLSSTIIIVKLFNDKKETTRLYAQITIGILLVQDIVATAAKIGLATKASGENSITDVAILISKGVGLILIMYAGSRYIVPKLTKALEGSKELLLLFALGWGLGFAALFEKVGFSIEIGALLAGVSLASLPYSSEMASRLKPLRDFFIVIFFITLGQAMTPGKLIDVLPYAIILSLLVVLFKPFTVLLSMGGLGYTKRASFKAAVSMSQISEFSLVFLTAALASGYVSEKASTTLTLVALITFAASTYLIKYDTHLYAKLEHHLRLFERKKTNYEQEAMLRSHSIILFGYRKGGQEFLKTFAKMPKRFLVVDYDPDVIDLLERKRVKYLYGDATDPELLEEMYLEKTKLVVSTISDHKTNLFIAHWLRNHNPDAVFVCSADNAVHASDLYADGAAYVMMPHYIGSEKISTFIRKNGFNKTKFKEFREKHLAYLETHFENPDPED
jgi:Kef-type K+ transport system membrane component KefB